MPRIKKPKWVQLTKENFRIGASVRVKSSIETPTFDWGLVCHNDIGVISDKYDLYTRGVFKCNFEKQPDWTADINEMEIIL